MADKSTSLPVTQTTTAANQNTLSKDSSNSIETPPLSTKQIINQVEDLEDEEDVEYEEYEVDEEEEEEEPLKVPPTVQKPNVVPNFEPANKSVVANNVVNTKGVPIEDEDEDEYEEEEIEYEEEVDEEVTDLDADDMELDQVDKKIDELLNKTSDLKQESKQNRTNIENKLSNIAAVASTPAQGPEAPNVVPIKATLSPPTPTANVNNDPPNLTNEQQPGLLKPPDPLLTSNEQSNNDSNEQTSGYLVEFEDDDEDLEQPEPKRSNSTGNLASLKHVSNKWNISELNDDDDIVQADDLTVKHKTLMVDSDDDFEPTPKSHVIKNPIIQQKLDIQKAIQAEKQRNNQDYAAQIEDDEEEINEIHVALEENFIEEEEEEEEDELLKPELENFKIDPLLSPRIGQNGNKTLRPVSPSSLILYQVRDLIINRNLAHLQTLLDQTPTFFMDAILKSGWTGLMFACYFAYPEMVAFCLNKGADPNYQNDDFSPLLAVCISQNTNEVELLMCLQLLLDAGARIIDSRLAVDKHGRGPLHHAARLGRAQLCKFLCHRGINVNRIDHNCFTALHHAVAENHENVVRTLTGDLLIKEQIQLDIQNKDGLTAWQYAIQIKHNQQIADIIKQTAVEQNISKQGQNQSSSIPNTNQTKQYETDLDSILDDNNNNLNDNGELQRKFVHDFVEKIITVAAAEVNASSLKSKLDDQNGSNRTNIQISVCPPKPPTNEQFEEDVEENEDDAIENPIIDNTIEPEFLLSSHVTDLSKKYSIDLTNKTADTLDPSSAIRPQQIQPRPEINLTWQAVLEHIVLTVLIYIIWKFIWKLFF